MSRSYRKPYDNNTDGADTKNGKRVTSRDIRRKAKRVANSGLSVLLDPEDLESFDAFIDDPKDKNRGRAGSRSADYGWMYFGDGRQYVGDAESKDYVDSVVRK